MFWCWVIAFALVVVSALLHIVGVVQFDTTVHWTAWLVVALVLLNGGWMTFDGGRPLVAGDFVTPKTGQLAGTLGPWSKVVAARTVRVRVAADAVSLDDRRVSQSPKDRLRD